MYFDRKEAVPGLIFLAFGSLYGWIAYRSLPLYAGRELGPGYFPVLLAACLALIGLLLVAKGIRKDPGQETGRISFRAVGIIAGSAVLFAATLDGLGLAVTLFLTTLAACFASDQIRLRQAAAISACVSALCTLIFGILLSLPVPIFGPWLGL